MRISEDITNLFYTSPHSLSSFSVRIMISSSSIRAVQSASITTGFPRPRSQDTLILIQEYVDLGRLFNTNRRGSSIDSDGIRSPSTWLYNVDCVCRRSFVFGKQLRSCFRLLSTCSQNHRYSIIMISPMTH